MRVETIIRLPEQLKEELMREAGERGYSFNEYVLLLIHKARRCQSQ